MGGLRDAHFSRERGATSVALDYIQSFPQLPGDTVFIFRGTSIC